MTELKAIETTYKGYNFRSRLEARWAVFFDALGIEWEYEAEGYDLDGVWYLPDFWLPTFNGGMYVEVKPKRELEDDEMDKIRLLVNHTKREVWLAKGMPEMKAYTVFYWSESNKDYSWMPAIPLICKAENENRMYVWPMEETDSKGNLLDQKDWLCGYKPASELYPHLFNAVNAAKSSRF